MGDAFGNPQYEDRMYRMWPGGLRELMPCDDVTKETCVNMGHITT